MASTVAAPSGFISESTVSAVSKNTALHNAVRVEAEDNSVGRSYSCTARGENIIRGLGAQRRALRTKSYQPYADGSKPTTTSLTMAWTNLAKSSRSEFLAYFRNTWELTDILFSALRDDSVFYMVPDKLRRPLIFYFCHPAALYINKMHQAGLVDHVHPWFQKLFETGVDEMSWDDMDAMQDEDFAWPDLPDAIAFRASVKTVVEEAISRMPDPSESEAGSAPSISQASPWWALVMGFEHERIHLETSAVLIHQLPIDCVREPEGWRTAPSFAPVPTAAPVNELVAVEPATVVLGKPVDFPSFGWDNEYGKRVVEVPAFSASKFMVSNAEFLPFVLAGGYQAKQWWVSPSGDDEGWRWRAFRNATHPSFWVASSHPEMRSFIGGRAGFPYQKDDGHERAGKELSFSLRTMFDIVPMPWDWPAEVNYHEASAFLRWKAATEAAAAGSAPAVYRMPTEAEYHALRADPSPFPEATVGRTPGAVAGGGAAKGAKLVAPGSGATFVEGECGGKVTLPAGFDSEADARSNGSVGCGERKAGKGGEAGGGSIVGVDSYGAVDVILQPTAPGNLNMRWGSCSPVDMYGPSEAGFHDTHGNAWEYTEDHFAPLPGYELHYLYDDFSAPCFDGWHTVIAGGSWVSTGDLASSFARYHFRRHFFQHLGFRYVRCEAGAAPEPYPGCATVTNLWEGMSTVSGDITDAYAPRADRLPYPAELTALDNAGAYATSLARLAAKAFLAHSLGAAVTSGSDADPLKAHANVLAGATVLHLGCGVGGGSFELARAGFGKVVGVDAREPAVRHARLFQHHGQFEYERVEEGVLTKTSLVRVPPGVGVGERSRVAFFVADARSLSPEVLSQGPFDVVVVDSFLTRLTQPLDLVTKLAAYTRPGGIAVVASNNDWVPSITPRNSWLGGFKMNGEDCATLGMLKYNLKRAFDLAEVCDVPRLTRRHARRFTLDVLETSVWRRHAPAPAAATGGC